MNTKEYLIVKNHSPLSDNIFHVEEKVNLQSILSNMSEVNASETLISIFEKINTENKCINLNFDIDKKLNKYSFLNFIRYVNFLYPYFSCRRMDVEINNEMIKLRLHTKYENATLGMLFKSDGTIDFTSLDKDKLKANEKLMYVLKGNFSSSNLYSGSHKIRRLLAIFNALEIEYELNRSLTETKEILDILKHMPKEVVKKKSKPMIAKKDLRKFASDLDSIQRIYDAI